jgi:co-chaperonin GroES (HSP10)
MITPVGGYCLVKPVVTEKISRGGIVLPATVQRSNEHVLCELVSLPPVAPPGEEHIYNALICSTGSSPVKGVKTVLVNSYDVQPEKLVETEEGDPVGLIYLTDVRAVVEYGTTA